MATVTRPLLLAALLVAANAGPARAAEVAEVAHDGRPYVALERVAALLDARADWTAHSIRARLTFGRQRVVVTRNWSQVLVNGRPLVLSAPAVVAAGEWLVPADFLTKVVPRIAPRARIALAKPGPAAPVRSPAASAPLPLVAEAIPPSPALPAPRAAIFSDLRIRSYPSFTRVVIEADVAFDYAVERRGDEVLVRLPGLGLAAPRVEQVDDGLVGELRLEPGRGGATARVQFQGASGQVRAATLDDPFRLVLDFSRPPPREERPAEVPLLQHIVLDAGHGGHDSGAIGPTGLMEKDLVLDVTLRVARLVEDKLRIKVSLSRSGDYFVPLAERTSFANRARADIFVSIHANAQRDLSAAGVETYFLSSEATDIAARQVAAKENSVVELESPVARQKMDVLRTILWDLAQSEFLAESSNLAEIIQDSMTQSLHIPTRGVKQAGFYVLGGAAMPAVLIEIGFVTNPREERRLKDSRYRDEIARAIFAGLAGYKTRYDQRMRASAGEARARR